MQKGIITASSDWHLIRKGDRAQNSTDPKLLREYLRWGFLDTDLTVLNGDIFDLGKTRYDTIMYGNGAYADLIKVMQNYMRYGKLKYVHGNHDIEMKEHWKLKDRLYIPEYKSLFIHGHQLEANPGVIGKPIEKFLLKILAFFERNVWEDIDQIPNLMNRYFHIDKENREKFFHNCEQYMNETKKWRKKYPVDNLFVGHVHGEPEVREISGWREIINDGCAVKICPTNKKPEDDPKNYRADYILFNTKNGEITAKDMRDGF